jgi:hypothetical protein
MSSSTETALVAANIGVYTDANHNLYVAETSPSLEDVKNGRGLEPGEVTVAIKSSGICGFVGHCPTFSKSSLKCGMHERTQRSLADFSVRLGPMCTSGNTAVLDRGRCQSHTFSVTNQLASLSQLIHRLRVFVWEIEWPSNHILPARRANHA